MKKLLFFLSVMLCACHASAQVKVGVEAGANLSRFVGSSSLPSEKKAKMGVQLGVNLDYEFMNHWLLMSGLTFIQTQGELKLGENYNGVQGDSYMNPTAFMKFPEVQTKVNYLQVPELVCFKSVHIFKRFCSLEKLILCEFRYNFNFHLFHLSILSRRYAAYCLRIKALQYSGG